MQLLGPPGRLSTVGEVALGDQTACEVAYREHSLALTRLAWLLTGSRERAEDTVHEVFLRYLRVDPPPDNPWAYLRRMVVNQVIDEGRKAAVEIRFRPDYDPVFHDGAMEDTWEVLTRLPADQRRALTLRYYADLPLTEIAAVMGVPIGTVKSWIHRGLERIREGNR